MTDEVATSGDKSTFGPSETNDVVLDLLVEQGHFKTSLNAFLAAAMFALQKGLDPSTAPSSAGTKWAGSAGTTKQVVDFLSWYVPTSTPVRLLEQLGNAGTAFIADKVRVGSYRLTEMFEMTKPDEQ